MYEQALRNGEEDMIQIKKGSKIGIVACSNAYPLSYQAKLEVLCQKVRALGWIPLLSQRMYVEDHVFSGTGKQKAEELMKMYQDPEIQAIFDISGGNLANEVIPWLDYDMIQNNPKPMFGYSDLTCILNAIHTKTNVPTYLYQLRNLMYEHGDLQESWLRETLIEGKNSLFEFPVRFIQGEKMEGVLIGGNIRCILKLAGTPYFPDLKGKVLALESMSGKAELIVSLLTQLKMLGAFEQVSGILLGTFTELDSDNSQPSIEELIVRVVEQLDLPIAITSSFGHGNDSKCLRIGEWIHLT